MLRRCLTLAAVLISIAIVLLIPLIGQAQSAVLPPPSLTLVSGEGPTAFSPPPCPNVQACVYSNQDFNGNWAFYAVPGSAGTGGTSFERIPWGEARSAKNKFANRIVVLAKGAEHNNKYCIPADTNRQGPFAGRDYIRIGPSGSSC